MKVQATEIDGRKVYSVRAFNAGIASWLSRLPTLWIEGEVTELRRQQRWASVFFTLKDPEDGACVPVQMPRGQFDALDLNLQEGERVHVFGRAELYEQRGELRLKALTVERYGLGAHLAALERLKKQLAAEGGEPVGNSPEEFARWVKGEIAKWTKVVKEANIKAE